MEKADLVELLVLEKKFNHKLAEIIDVTRELAESVDRQDRISVQMILSMRQKPILELQEIRACIALKRVDLSREDAAEFDRLLEGGDGDGPDARAVAEQTAANRRALERLAELDSRVNRKLCGGDSCYSEG